MTISVSSFVWLYSHSLPNPRLFTGIRIGRDSHWISLHREKCRTWLRR